MSKYAYPTGAPKVLSGRFAGLLASVASLHSKSPPAVEEFLQEQESRSKVHSARIMEAWEGTAISWEREERAKMCIAKVNGLEDKNKKGEGFGGCFLLLQSPSKKVTSSTAMYPLTLLLPQTPSMMTFKLGRKMYLHHQGSLRFILCSPQSPSPSLSLPVRISTTVPVRSAASRSGS